MTRPPWEVADVIRRAGNRFIERYRKSLSLGATQCASAQSRAAARRRSVDIATNVFAAVIGPSPITPAAIAIVRSARRTRVRNGCAHGSKNCCRWVIFTWSSAFPMRWFR